MLSYSILTYSFFRFSRFLEARAEELSRRMTTNVSAQEPVGEKGEGTAKDGNRLIGLLESLAERLEARAR